MINKIQDVQSTPNLNGARRRWSMFGQDGAPSPQDGLAVSDFAREMANISSEMAKIPDVREDRVNELKSRIEAGTYEPDIDALAARLVWAGITSVE